MGEFLYQVMFANGRVIQFYADSIEDYGSTYTFKVNGDTIAEFQQNNIAGYLIVGVNEHE